ncbi:ATP-binding protein [Spiroplasma chrysopicola]|uniref:Primosomal protein DnaI n=1 Tax=Spiroplasma chrysopicola DF-1 TaxID=1276227 RepID=R4U0G2_9MOLU|nr:ATP-binding protein [Spiroplasma chrysopicola]AGM24727.1 primosomal protein DnaI [Spiroplasma chrysopicola DF-1]
MEKTALLEQINHNPELLENLAIIKFQGDDNYQKYADLFNEYLNNYHFCDKNPNLELCPQSFKGYKYYFSFVNGALMLTRVECNHMLAFKELNRVQNNYLYFDFAPELLKLRLKDISKDYNFHNVQPIIPEMVKFVKGERKKGLYIYGNPGIGKTHLMISFANKLAEKDFKIAFISVINLINKIKDSFNNVNNDDSFLVQTLLKADVLFLDDIGGEAVSPWVRDDLLFRVLNDRISRHKPVFFTSNFSINQLLLIYANIKGENMDPNINKIKTLRIVDRIKGLATEFELLGESRR